MRVGSIMADYLHMYNPLYSFVYLAFNSLWTHTTVVLICYHGIAGLYV